jgi:hypothetical protein
LIDKIDGLKQCWCATAMLCSRLFHAGCKVSATTIWSLVSLTTVLSETIFSNIWIRHGVPSCLQVSTKAREYMEYFETCCGC